MAQVVVADPEAAGLTAMLAGLIEAAITTPAKAAILDAMRGSVAIVVPDAEVEVAMHFGGGVCRVESGPTPSATVRLSMPADVLLDLPSLPLFAGFPSLLAPGGRAFARRVLAGDVQISGMRHLRLLAQLNRLLALG
ncbi:MAG TPA: hypothetical protein VNB94_13610 [Mycobacteriales bacterium]|nr:hypothetical protein [Mycobacteriales bacterium]